MILDTNAISTWASGDSALLARLAGASQLYLPVPALGEFRFGLLQSRKKDELEEWLRRVESRCQVLGTDGTTAQHYARLRLQLKTRGRPIPVNDLWIAALATQHQLSILSRDAHFDELPHLQRIAW